jgi:hypothetical protein
MMSTRVLLALLCLAVHATGASAQPPRLEWKSIGPDGGQVSAIAIDPSNASRIFVGSPGGGIWKTSDGGASWAPVNDFLPTLIVNCLVFKPGDPSNVFACVSDPGPAGTALLKSTDGGETWSPILSASAAGLRNIGDLAIGANGLTMLALSPCGVVRSADGGITWSSCSFSFNGPAPHKNVVFLPGSSTRAVMPGSYTTDGGVTWQPSEGSWDSGQVAVSPGAPNTIYFLGIHDVFPGNVPPTLAAAVWKSVNGGMSYTFCKQIEYGLSSANVLFPANRDRLELNPAILGAIWTDPINANTVIAGADNLYRSLDGCQTWTRISDGAIAPRSAAAGQQAIASDPRYDGAGNRRVYFGTDAGVFKTEDAATVTASDGGGFTALNTGLAITKFTSGAGHAASGIVIGSAWSGIWRGSAHAGALWTRVRSNDDFSGEGKRGRMGRTAIDPTDSSYMYGPANRGSYAWRFTMSRSVDGGTTWTGLSSKISDISWFSLDPNDPSVLLAAGGSLPTEGVSRISGLKPAGTPTSTLIRDTAVTQLAIAPGNSNLIWVTDGTVLSVTHNGTAEQPLWEAAGPGLPSGPVTGITIDAIDNQRVFVAFGRTSPGNVWQTTDGGATWAEASGSGSTALPALAVRSVATHPRNPALIYAGTDAGLYSSRDGGATWREDGPARVSVTDLFWMDTRLVAVTDGRGMFNAPTTALSMSLDDPKPSQALAPAIIVRGWSFDQSAASGTGVDAVHVYGFPDPGSGAPPVFLGAASFVERDDVAAVFGDRYRHSGFELRIDSLAAGPWMIVAYARSTVSQSFDLSRAAIFSVAQPGSRPAMAIDTPSGTVGPGFSVRGWALDAGSSDGPGVDAVHVYAAPADGSAWTFLGAATHGEERLDVSYVYGARFVNPGYSLDVRGLAQGEYTLIVFARSVVSGSWFSETRRITVRPSDAVMTIDTPGYGASVGQPFLLAGWAIDRDAASGTGVDTLHVWAFPSDGSAAHFIGVADTGGVRGDVGAAYGSQFTNSGYNVTVSGLPPGQYQIVVYAHSTVTGTFNQSRVVTVVVQ